MSKCKRCNSKTVLSDSDIQKMIEEVTNMKGICLADTDTYNSRFEICLDCDKFMYGSTCGVCGCVMQVRARLRDGKCPIKKW